MFCESCGRKLDDAAVTCPDCGTVTGTPVKVSTLASSSAGGSSSSAGAAVAPAPEPRQVVTPKESPLPSAPPAMPPQPGVEGLVMRAGEQIWHFTEREGQIEAGKRRPLLIMDEQSVHLCATDRRLESGELLRRAQTIIAAQNVPVEVQLVDARWIGDSREIRPRLVASLKDHSYSDIKMIMGLDYMGAWASFQLLMGIEPGPMPQFQRPMLAIILMIGGGLLAVLGLAVAKSSSLAWLGLGLAGVGLYMYWQSHKRWDAEQRQRAMQKATERLSRTFKVDDMRLFSMAMQQVFHAVVDDIVERGGKVVQIRGGEGGYFQAGRTPRRSDAGEAPV
jgi:hypothetical protein